MKISSRSRCILNVVMLGALFGHDAAIAYEVQTHGLITQQAFEKSVLREGAAQDVYLRLGFDRLQADYPFQQSGDSCSSGAAAPTKDAYIDARGVWMDPATAPDAANRQFRCVQNYELVAMPPEYRQLPGVALTLGTTPELRFEGWLMRGVIREDDLKAKNYGRDELKPDPDPWGEQDRPITHFYVPISNEAGLVPFSNPIFNPKSALQSAMGTAADPLDASPVPDPSRGNRFSYLDARRNMFLALTYKEPRTTISAAGGKLDSDIRMSLWASTLKALGHVSHLLQDQASPQHSRGEPHNYVCRGFFSLFNQDIATRTYENFVNYRTIYSVFDPNDSGISKNYIATNSCEERRWLNMFQKAGQGRSQLPLSDPWLVANTYPIPQFSVQRKFFTTRNPGDNDTGDLLTRAGLGDYANRGFYTEGKMAGSFTSPPAQSNDPSFTEGEIRGLIVPGKGKVKVKALFWRVPDAVSPNYSDAGLSAENKAPIVSYGQFGFLGAYGTRRRIMTLDNYNQMADMLVPRAIAYTTGLINFFFRGKLEIEPIAQKLFGVVDLGQPHTMVNGYPIITDTNKILGFEKIRLKVRNLTEVIVESGSAVNVPQVVGVGKLVAVARYHRNPCYKPDLSGERSIAYSPLPFGGIITEPSCATGVRTNYQEISVSAPLAIANEAELPGGRGGAAPDSVEKIFDFSADPIPVNATDLFIQVVYRGQLGEETDGIAVGTLDVQEPTFFATWNNTDYYFSELSNAWLVQNPLSFPSRSAAGVVVCAGGPSTLVYRYIPENGPGLPFYQGIPPVVLDAGVIRLAMVFSKRTGTTLRYNFRVNPLMLPPPSAQQRLVASPGQERQASREIFSASDPLPAPSYCARTPPAVGSTYWCWDPVQKRRGQNFGDAAQPIYYTSSANGPIGPDVDAFPAQALLPGLRVLAGGVNRYNQDQTLTACPSPTLSPEEVRAMELREAAWDAGIDPDAAGL